MIDGILDGILDVSGRRACMNRCAFCFSKSRIIAEWAPILKKIDDLLSIGATRFHIEGTDACEWDRLPELIDYLKNKGIHHIGLGTHGRTLKDPKFVQRLKDTGVVESINIPLYGSVESIHNGIVQSRKGSPGNAFQDTIQGIKNCVEIGIPIRGHTGLTQSNKEDISNILKLYVSLTQGKVESIDIVPLFVLLPFKLYIRKWILPTKDMGPYLREAYNNFPPGIRITIQQVPYCVFGSYSSVIDSRVLIAPDESSKSRKFFPGTTIINTPTESSKHVAGYRRKSYFEECSHCTLKQQCVGLPSYELRLFGSSGLKAL